LDRKVFLLDQFDGCFLDLINDFNCSSAICGYFSIANGYLIHDYWEQNNLQNVEEMNQLITYLMDVSQIKSKLEDSMMFIQIARINYIVAHQQDFSNKKDEGIYMKDWVANYEISDYLNTNPNPHIIFLRNIERKPETCKHEEKKRLVEEIPFHNDDFFFLNNLIRLNLKRNFILPSSGSKKNVLGLSI